MRNLDPDSLDKVRVKEIHEMLSRTELASRVRLIYRLREQDIPAFFRKAGIATVYYISLHSARGGVNSAYYVFDHPMRGVFTDHEIYREELTGLSHSEILAEAKRIREGWSEEERARRYECYLP